MEYSTVTIDGRASDDEQQRAQFLGFVLRLAAERPVHNRIGLRAVTERALCAYSLGQYKLYFNSYGQCVGYLLWACLSPAVERRFLGTPDSSLHMSEWCEGGSLWILDFVVPFGSLAEVMRDCRDDLFKEHRQVTYFKYKHDKRLAKRMSRDSVSHFFRAEAAAAGSAPELVQLRAA